MENCSMNIKVSQFRAVNKANIKLNGITVVTGENGCGKTTLSRLIYHTLIACIDFEKIVKYKLKYELRHEIDIIEDFLREISFGKQYQFREWLKSDEIEENNLENFENKLNSYIDFIQKYLTNIPYEQLNESPKEKTRINTKVNRITKILGNLADINDAPVHFPVAETITDSIDKLKSHITSIIQTTNEIIKKRDISVYTDILSEIFNQKCDKKFYLNEFDILITDWEEGKLENTHWVKDCVYVDTPMAVNDPSTRDIYWRDLINTLRKKNGAVSKNAEQLENINHIISGEVSYNQEVLEEGFKFKRLDGSIFDLQECATGIKSFGIIQVLLKNGILNKDTLLIIDEPEAHLHPQWIVEYARMVVLLNKHIGIKFFIASHNPDMVSALKYISEKEGISDNLNFYLAEKAKNEFVYDYKSLGTDIDEIFSSFNIALDRISKYGIIENEIL